MLDTENDHYRKFNYAIDIKQHISFDSLLLSEELIAQIKSSLSQQSNVRQTFSVTIDETSSITPVAKTISNSYYAKINTGYLSRRLGSSRVKP